MPSKKPTGRGPGRPRKPQNTPGTRLEMIQGGGKTPPPPPPAALPPAVPGGTAPLSQLPKDTLPEIPPYGEPAGAECMQCATAIRKLQQRGQSTPTQDAWLQLYEELHPNPALSRLQGQQAPAPPAAAAQANANAAPIHVNVGGGQAPPPYYPPPGLPAMPRALKSVGEITAEGQQTTGIMGKYAELTDRVIKMSEEHTALSNKVFEHLTRRDKEKEEAEREKNEMLQKMAMRGLKMQFKAAKRMAKAIRREGEVERQSALMEEEVRARVEAAAEEIAEGMAPALQGAASDTRFAETMKRAGSLILPALPLLLAKIAPFLGLPEELVAQTVQGLMAQATPPAPALPEKPATPEKEKKP